MLTPALRVIRVSTIPALTMSERSSAVVSELQHNRYVGVTSPGKAQSVSYNSQTLGTP